MKDPDVTMKKNELSTSDLMNGNWVSKRKRKKIPSGSMKPNGGVTDSVPSQSRMVTSSKDKLKKESSSDFGPSKERGHDGNYYECAICDLGGDLLCCDSCPRTYHIECLDPPLKQIPTGKWNCPSCSLNKSSVEPVDDSDRSSKRTKTNVTSKKSKSKVKSAKTDKAGKKRLKKEKSAVSSPNAEASGSSFPDVEDEKPIGEKENTVLEIEMNEEKSDEDDFPKKKVVLGVESVRKKSMKRKRTIKSKFPLDEEVIKKPKNDKGKNGKSHLSSSSSQIKQKSVKHTKAKSLSRDDMGSDICDVYFKDEVDRVLGCRIVAVETNFVHHQSATEADNNIGPVEENVTCNASDVGDVKTVKEGTGNILTRDCGEENVVDLVDEPVDDPGSTSTNKKNKDDSVSTANDLAKPSEEIPTGDNPNGISNALEIKDHKIDVNIEANNDNEKKESYEFLVKWAGKSHLHNTWVSESQLKVIAKRKYDNYKFKYGRTVINICEEKWKVPQRVIAKDGSTHVYVKWTGLPYDECTWEKTDEPVIMKSSHLIDLFNLFEQQTLEKEVSKNEAYKEKGNDVITLIEQPKELKGSLFPHQLEALNWLRKCWSKSKNVILADEMGLGKTISASAFLSSLYFEFKARLPSLVLVPLSTMPNWMAEFSLWAPNLNVVEYHGCSKARALMREYEWHASDPLTSKKTSSYKFNVLLTTYEMILADSAHLSKIPWEALIVDEGHRLKNSGSKLFSLLNTFSFQHRVLLTGTPLQNNFGEMYNLLNFLQPASFPSLKSFEDKFSDLTTAEKVDELKKLVAPHMLRRLKKDAMQNIPPKTERVVPVDLSTIQAEYYRAMLTKNYQVLRNIGKGVPQQSMLNIVMQLRKVCNHPYLIPGTEPETGSIEFLQDMRIKASAKLGLLHSMLKILHKEGHRILIFSQMTKLLDILEDYLTIEFGPTAFERVDGSVSIADRQIRIARFNQDTSRFVFLLSTRACGLGINLASADTVIIYDSDFNPHADIQAMNRAHRIGQSKRLLVYRLVVRASVEERILQLAKKKLMLDHLFVNKSGSNTLTLFIFIHIFATFPISLELNLFMDAPMKTDKQPPLSSFDLQQHELPQRPIWQIVMVASIAAGVQFGWALQLSLLTPYVQLIGVPHAWSSFIWLCGPISGMVVQPVVGYYSDRCTSRFGRRRPFIAIGAFLVGVAVFFIGYAADIGVSTGDHLGAHSKPRAIAIFVIGFWILDVANNTLQGPCRAFIADLSGSNSSKIRTGNAVYAFFMGVGNVLGYAAGSYPRLYKFAPFTKTDACEIYCANLKTCFFISIALLASVTILACALVSEDQYVPEADDDKSSEKNLLFFAEMFRALKGLSRPMWILLLVTCLNWIAWFPFLLYDTDWMGKEVYGGTVGDRLYNQGVRKGALGLMLNSVVSGLFSLLIEQLSRWSGGVKRVWGGLNFVLALSLGMTVVVTKIAESSRVYHVMADGTRVLQPPSTGVLAGALSIFAVLGAPLAVTFSVPCALASIFSNDSGAGQGLSLGVLNLAIVIPQMVVSVLSGPWDAVFGGSNLPAFVVASGAAAISGIFAFCMLPTPASEVKISGGGAH